MHAAFADGELLMKRKHSILFDQLMEIKAGEELMQKYDEVLKISYIEILIEKFLTRKLRNSALWLRSELTRIISS